MSRRSLTLMAASSMLLLSTAACSTGTHAASAAPQAQNKAVASVDYASRVSTGAHVTKTSGTSAAFTPRCSTMTKAQAARLAASRLPQWRTGFPWSASAASNHYDACSALSWIDLPVANGTASSPHQIALFHDGRYLGTATKNPQAFTPTILRLGDSSIRVTYHWPRRGEANAYASGTTVAGFTWNAARQHVVMTGQVPPQLY